MLVLEDIGAVPRLDAMRRLHDDHIIALPLRPNGTPAHAAAAHAGGGDVAFAVVARYAGLGAPRRPIGAARMLATLQEDGAERVLDAALRWIRRSPQEPTSLLE